MAQTNEDKLSRLRAMVADNGDTWDLSGNDQDAIKFALDRISELESQASDLRGLVSEVEDFIEEVGRAPSRDWLKRFYLTTGDHMICTDEGWTLGSSKSEYSPEYITDEVNAPK